MHEPTHVNRHQFWLGVTRTLPLALGAIPFGLAYGVVSIKAGLTIAETLLMSLIVFAGASQFMAVVMIQAGAGTALIVASISCSSPSVRLVTCFSATPTCVSSRLRVRSQLLPILEPCQT